MIERIIRWSWRKAEGMEPESEKREVLRGALAVGLFSGLIGWLIWLYQDPLCWPSVSSPGCKMFLEGALFNSPMLLLLMFAAGALLAFPACMALDREKRNTAEARAEAATAKAEAAAARAEAATARQEVIDERKKADARVEQIIREAASERRRDREQMMKFLSSIISRDKAAPKNSNAPSAQVYEDDYLLGR